MHLHCIYTDRLFEESTVGSQKQPTAISVSFCERWFSFFHHLSCSTPFIILLTHYSLYTYKSISTNSSIVNYIYILFFCLQVSVPTNFGDYCTPQRNQSACSIFSSIFNLTMCVIMGETIFVVFMYRLLVIIVYADMLSVMSTLSPMYKCINQTINVRVK